jgi:hypothetical protein
MNWLKTELLTGFQKLLCLGLDRTPATDLIEGTVAAWMETITHGRLFEQERDTPRIRAAFRTIAGRCRTWPAPVDFLDALPRIESPPMARRIESGGSREVAMKHIAELTAKLRIPPATPHTEVDA